MMQSWFDRVERIAALENCAASWVGTPFVANSRVKGQRGGVCCHMLAEQLYCGAGYPLEWNVPAGSMKWCDISQTSLIEKFFEGQTALFDCIETPVEMIPGDVVGFRIGGCVHHVGVVLGRGQFIHAMRGLGTAICNLNDPTYSGRIEKIWRPRP